MRYSVSGNNSGLALYVALVMGTERRKCNTSDPQVTKRLFAILILMIGLICIFGGYMLGRMARDEVKRNNELLTYNLTAVADSLYKKAKRISPKVVHHHDSEKIRAKLANIFDCTSFSCAFMDDYSLNDFIRTSINCQVVKLMKSVYNASLYLDTLR